jgi:hypothetical protein
MNNRIEKLLEHVRVNEQIERLAKESGCTIDRLGFGEGNLEKFAELIVRECLGISYKESHLPNAILFDERSDKFIKDIHHRIDRVTKKYFGVE